MTCIFFRFPFPSLFDFKRTETTILKDRFVHSFAKKKYNFFNVRKKEDFLSEGKK